MTENLGATAIFEWITETSLHYLMYVWPCIIYENDIYMSIFRSFFI